MDLKKFVELQENFENIVEVKDVVEPIVEIKLEEDAKIVPEKKTKKTKSKIVEELHEVEERIIDSKSPLNFIGAFNYIPDSREYPAGTQYRNVNEGIVYINHNNLWEEYVRDGKKGEPTRWSPSSGGLGEADVKRVTGIVGRFDNYASLPTGQPDGSTAWVGATQYVVSGGAWVAGGNLGLFVAYSSLPTVANNGDIAYIPQFVGAELVRMRYVTADAAWAVDVGQCVINAHDIFEVVSAPSMAGIAYTLPFSQGILRPLQIWEAVSYATGVIGATGAGYRTTFGGTTQNTAKVSMTPATPRGRERKVFARRSSGNVDVIEWNGSVASTVDASFSDAINPQVTFEPSQTGDSFMLRNYSLRRIG